MRWTGVGLLAALALVLCPTRFAAADEARARAALQLAFARAQTEAKAAPRLAFVETVAEKGVQVAAQFDPARPAKLRWAPLRAPKTAQERDSLEGIYKDTPDETDLLLHRVQGAVSGEGTLVADHAGIATFEFAMSPQARPTKTLLDKVGDLQSHIRVSITVDENRGVMTGMRFFAPKAFRITPIAEVNRVDLTFAFGASFDGGPEVVRRVDTDVAYRLAGAAKTVRDTVWFSEIQPRPGRALG